MSKQIEPHETESWIDKIELGIAVALQIGIFIVVVGALVEDSG